VSTKLNEQPNRIIIYLALVGLLGAGLWLRLRFIQTLQLFPDEFVTLLAIRMIGQKGLPLMPSGLFYDHGLLYSYLGSLAAFFGPARWAARYASLICGLLTMGLTFFVGRRWSSPAVGLIAATGLAVAPAAIEWSGRVRMYALLQLLILLTLWLAYEGIVDDKPGWRWAALLAYLGATLTHFVAVTLAPPLVLAALGLRWLGTRGSEPAGSLARLRRPVWWTRHRSWWFQAITLGAILIIAFVVKRAGQPKGIDVLEPTQTVTGIGQVLTIYGDLSFNLSGGWQAISPFYLSRPALIYGPFALVMLIYSIISIRALIRGSSPQRPLTDPAPRLQPSLSSQSSFFLALILITTTFEMILFVSADRRDDKYLFMLLPALFLLGAQGLALTGHVLLGLITNQPSDPHPRPHIPHPKSLIPTLLLSGLILTLSQPAVQVLLANSGDDYDAAFVYVREHWQPGDTILTGTPAAAAFYLGRSDFYSVQRRGGYDYRILTVGGQAVDRWLASPAIRTEAALNETLAHNNVWLVLERWGLQGEYYDPPFQQQLLAQTDFLSETQGIFILRSKPDPQPLPMSPTHSVEANFGQLIRLTGYTIEPDQPAPGQTIRLTLHWQALAPIPHDYTVFVHLREPNGGNVAQADHRPLGNLYPTSLWPVGETIRETSELILPADFPPGSYEVWTGLYLLESGERLAVQNDTSGENAVRLGELTLK
jgi:hypothetical protein